VLRRIRGFSDVPVIVVSVREDQSDKVAALDAGADDYVTKPFGVAELVARTAALLRRTESRSPRAVRFGDVEFEPEARIVRRGGSEIHLTPLEFALLTAFLSKPGTVWTHRQLMAAVWGTTAGVTTDTLRVHVGSLRRKLELDPNRPRFFRTEPWVGYRFTPEE